MAATTPWVVLGNLLFAIACGAVAVHLISLAWRTRRTPELFLGLGLIFLVAGFSMFAVSGMGRTTVGEASVPLIALGSIAVSLSVFFQCAFAASTFRLGRRWAITMTFLLGFAELCISVGIVYSLLHCSRAPPEFTASYLGMFLLRLPLAVSYAWIAIDGLLQYRVALRRQKLGMGDAALTHRFFLFFIMGTIHCTNWIVSSGLHLQGMTPFNHPLGAASLGVGSTLASLALYLALLPPVRYLDWIKQRNLPSEA